MDSVVTAAPKAPATGGFPLQLESLYKKRQAFAILLRRNFFARRQNLDKKEWFLPQNPSYVMICAEGATFCDIAGLYLLRHFCGKGRAMQPFSVSEILFYAGLLLAALACAAFLFCLVTAKIKAARLETVLTAEYGPKKL